MIIQSKYNINYTLNGIKENLKFQKNVLLIQKISCKQGIIKYHHRYVQRSF